MTGEIRAELQNKAVRTDVIRNVVALASELNERDQTVLFFVLREKSQTSIANIMGIPQQTVSWVMSNRLRKFAEMLVKLNAQVQYSNREGGV